MQNFKKNSKLANLVRIQKGQNLQKDAKNLRKEAQNLQKEAKMYVKKAAEFYTTVANLIKALRS